MLTAKIDTALGVKEINDKDLVELGGYHAYHKYPSDKEFIVNGHHYRVINTSYDGKDGFDALTVVNTVSNEVSVIFVGTDPTDINDVVTDLKLLSDVPPSQIKQAQKYYNDMNRKFGVTSVAGNSLGGALANAVGIEHPNVKVVTLNPALLPDGMMVPHQKYDNIANYFSRYDILTLGEKAGGYDKRIPGKHYTINNGVPVFNQVGVNHTGYIKGDGITAEYGQVFTIEDTDIDIAADDHIVTSIWTGEPLYGSRSQVIDINYEALETLAKALQKEVQEKLGNVNKYLSKSQKIVDSEKDLFYNRIDQLKDKFRELYEKIFYGRFSMGSFKVNIDDLTKRLHLIERKCIAFRDLLLSPPLDIMPHISLPAFYVDHHFVKLHQHLLDLNDTATRLVNNYNQTIDEKIPELFSEHKHRFRDAVVDELRAHFDIIKKNKEKIYDQLMTYEKQTQQTAAAFKRSDVYDPNKMKPEVNGPPTKTYTLEKSPYMKNGLLTKVTHIDQYFQFFSEWAFKHLLPLISDIEALLIFIQSVLISISSSIKVSADILTLKGTLPGKFIDSFTHFDDKVRSVAQQITTPIDELIADIKGLEKVLGRVIIDFPAILTNFKSYFEQALFLNAKYEDVNLYNTAALALLEELDVLFNDIVYQLSENKGRAIKALCEASKHIKKNIKRLNGQVAQVTV
ncbi:SA1320 family protein [Camelliibacillus cellulosilyticus]|uniref:SA1320 family protein n=1 Tax=Camelliibacillus cellulosilyticus TaxID=2174486 RepID=A0ABV9GMS9_9BACL